MCVTLIVYELAYKSCTPFMLITYARLIFKSLKHNLINVKSANEIETPKYCR